MVTKKQAQESENQWVGRMIKRLQSAWPLMFRDADSDEWEAALMRKAKEVGQGRVSSAITRMVDDFTRKNNDYPPSIAKMWEYIPASETKFIPCGNCQEGWLRTFEGQTVGWHDIDPHLGAVVPCDCFTRWKAGYGNTAVEVSDQDRKRSGERQYGETDVKCLHVMHKKLRAKLGRPLSEAELDQLVIDLDAMIDMAEKQRRTQ